MGSGAAAAAYSNSVGHSMASAGAMPSHRPNGKHQQEMINGIGNTTTTTSSSEMKQCGSCSFQMPLHYPRYKKADYESMPEWQLDCLLSQYGLPVSGDVTHKRNFAMGAFIWPSQY